MGFEVTLNGSNHVSEARVRAFEETLAQRDHRAASRGREKAPRVEAPPQPAMAEVRPAAPSVDYARVFESLERGLAQSYGHQSETLRVHHQYLNNEAAYAGIFAQLMEEQGVLFDHGTVSPERAEVLLHVMQTLARSFEQFHAHQSETLNVHYEFLAQQATYAQSFVTLLREHYGSVLGADGHRGHNGNGNGHNGTDSGTQVLSLPAQPALRAAAATAPRPVVQAPEPEVPVVRQDAVSVVRRDEAPRTAVEMSDAAPVGERADLAPSLLAIVSDKTGYPTEMLDLDMDMEADLGIDSIKRVEILGALQDAHPDMPEVETEALAELRTLGQIIAYTAQSGPEAQTVASPTAPVVAAAPAAVPQPPTERGGLSLKQDLLSIVSVKTGYPTEMLDPEMDMEADLGIDSIKRVEILGALQDAHPDLPEVEVEVLAELRTLAQILDHMKREAAPKKA